jgi:hypothetical protein
MSDDADIMAPHRPQIALLSCDGHAAAQLTASIQSLVRDFGGTIWIEAVDSQSTALMIAIPQSRLGTLTSALLLGGATLLPQPSAGQTNLTVIVRAVLPCKQPFNTDGLANDMAARRDGAKP